MTLRKRCSGEATVGEDSRNLWNISKLCFRSDSGGEVSDSFNQPRQNSAGKHLKRPW